ncbi:thioredoxin [Medicago truncatula]|uniref:Thioredoxin n=1 Tax=Medicago truncatula TaxID=3880 RepID=A0A072VAB4_MEDTR|nr:thioredoxin [Medicago truncatula]
MATAQLESLPSYLLSATTRDAFDGGLILIIIPIFAWLPVTDESFGSLVLKSKTLVLVEFYAPWCESCKNTHSIMVELANDYEGKVEFYKLNMDDNQNIPVEYGIQGIPTVIFFKNGEQVDIIVGHVTKATFIDRIEQYIYERANKQGSIKPIMSSLDVLLS